MAARWIAVALVAALLAFQVVRSAMVRQSPAGTTLWSAHPEALLARTMAEIGAAAGRGQRVSPALLAQVEQVARRMPLAPEPFLIHGALAQMAGDFPKAERLYREARTRDPRSAAARYFLAERHLMKGEVEPALTEMAVLSRLTGALGAFAPALAAYAKTPGAVPRLRRFFAQAPEFEPVVLSQLAGDAGNLALIRALWSGESEAQRPGQSAWQTVLVAKLVQAGDYRRAIAAWREFAGVQGAPPAVFNPEFRKLTAPPPFNWTFGSAGGLAQPAGTGDLDVIYFGRDEAVLAEQTLLLAPGRYALAMQVRGEVEPGSGVAWSVECLDPKRALLSLPVDRQSSSWLRATFTVPAGCQAQRLALAGTPGEFPTAIEFTVRRFQLARAEGA